MFLFCHIELAYTHIHQDINSQTEEKCAHLFHREEKKEIIRN